MVIDDSKDVVVLGFCDGFIQYNFDMKIKNIKNLIFYLLPIYF